MATLLCAAVAGAQTATVTGAVTMGGAPVRGAIRYHPVRAGEINDVVRPREVAALEAYPGIAPAEFSNHTGCATVVIWTKTRLGT